VVIVHIKNAITRLKVGHTQGIVIACNARCS
jgi:hypothetical protein